MGEKYKTDFPNITMLTRGVELCRTEHNRGRIVSERTQYLCYQNNKEIFYYKQRVILFVLYKSCYVFRFFLP